MFNKSFPLFFVFLIYLSSLNSQISFSDQTINLGIEVVCGNTELGNGITFFDYDNDGWDDISIATVEGDPIRFFKNINGNFVEQILNIEDNNKQNKQINWVDIDNDGDNDLFTTSNNSSIKIYENLGNMIMLDITDSSGMLTDSFPTYGASWGDYNNDGYLDVFLSMFDLTTPNILYKNNGDKTFTLVNAEVGLLNSGYLSFCSAFIDYDNDGDQDIYVANDRHHIPNLMYRNNGDNTFTEVGTVTGTDLYIGAVTITVEDINSDGWLDIYVTNDAPDDSILLLNNSDGTFSNASNSYGVAFNSTGWGAVFLDAENDMDLDLYVSGSTNGTVVNELSSAFYENNNDGSFNLNESATINDNAISYSNAIGDTNNDGLPEIVVNNYLHDNIFLWENTSSSNNNWLKVSLEGTTSNRMGVGSLIEISVNGEKQYRYTLCGEGYLSQNSGIELFGLGTSTTVDYVKVKWLSGIEDIIYNVNSNQVLNIVEGSETLHADDLSQNNALTYGPNPVLDILTIDSENILSLITVYDILANEVLQVKSNDTSIELDVSSLHSGFYFVNVVTGFSNSGFKFVKI